MMQLEETHKLQNPIDFDSENILNEIKTSVHNLYEFKNKYLNEWADKYGVFNDSMTELWMRNDTIHSMINESCELVRKKNEIIQSKFEDTISVLKKYEAMFTHVSALEKAEFCYQYGRVFNAIDSNLYAGNLNDMEENDLTCQAIHWLTKALKFNPQHLDAWCELGDSCWRQGDPVQAAEHFRQALKIDPKHVNALCHLSMVIRQLPILNNNDDDNVLNELNSSQSYTKSSIFSQSVDLAHTAVGQQPTNGHAWSILGNALLTMFFKRYGSIAPYPLISQSYSFNVKNANNDDNNKTVTESTVIKSPVTSSQIIMTRCLAAYSQAVKDRSTALEPSFHYNRGSAWHYQGIFGQTLRCWLQAVCLDPDWSAPQNGIKRIIKFILEWNTLIKQFTDNHSNDYVKLVDNSNTEGKPDKELTSSVLKNSTNQELLNRNQQQQQINEFILPLSPLKTLLSIEHTNLSTSQVDQLDKDIKLTLDMKDIMALNRLMGPYCPSVSNANNTNDKNDILLSTEKRKGGSKKKKRVKSSKYPPPTTTTTATTTTGASNNNDPAGDSMNSSLINSIINSRQLRFTLFNNLQVGLNKHTVCVGRVFAELPFDSDLAMNLLLVDAHGTPFGVRLYNVGKGTGPTRNDIVAIPHPFVEEIFIEGFVLHSCITALSVLDSKYISTDMISKLANLYIATTTLPISTTISNTNISSSSSSSSNGGTGSTLNSKLSKESPNLLRDIMDIRIRMIRVPLPDFLVVNGQPVGSSWTAAPILKNIFFTKN